MGLEDVDVLETKTNGAPAKKGIQFVADVDRADGELVATEVEGTNDERVWLHLLGHFSIGLVLFLFARERIAIHKEKLGPIKPNAFGAVFRNGVDVARELDVGGKNDVTAVAGGRCGLAKLL